MSSIQQHFLHRAQGKSLLEFNRTNHQTDSIVPASRLQSWIQWQIVVTVRSRNHVEMVTVEVLLSGAIPACIAVGLGVNTRMVAISKALGLEKVEQPITW